MTQRRFLGAPGVRALVVGTATHQPGSVLPDLPTVAATARDLRATLVGRCGLTDDQVRVAVDLATPVEFAQLLHESAAEASDVLVVAFLGHGLVGPAGDLYLAVGATARLGTELTYQALPFDIVRTILSDCPARSIVVLLDCCFAGLADGPIGDVTGDGFAAAQVRGSYLLAAAAASESAMAPVDEPHTAFTGALIDLLTDGDPTGPPALTLDHAFHYVERTLTARRLPRPRRHVMDSSGDIVLAPNPAYATPHVPAPAAPDPDSACPYPGLSAYRPEDSRYFFGRETLTAQLAERVASHPWQHGPLMVLGASGAGKSSLLGAGLVPALHEGRVPLAGSWSWRAMLITPTDLLAGRIELPAQGRLLLIVDQFEELFTECADPAAFVAMLCDLCRPADDELPRVLVILGMRADYYQECTRLPALVSALEQGPVVVGPMSTEQLRVAIEGPAAAAGLVLEAGLVDRLVYDLGEPAGSLPLLSHALLSTWLARSGRVLTLAGYQSSGGIADAVGQTAERVYGDLDEDGRRVARRVLLSLVRIDDSAQDTRGRVRLADVVGDAVVSQRVVAALVRARLVEVGTGPDVPDSVEIAHEALLRAWPRLRNWIDEDRTWLLARQSLGAAARAWVHEQRDPSGLYQGPRLAAATAVLGDRIAELSDVEREFLEASARQADAERRARRRRTLVLRGLSASLVVLLLVVVGVVVAVVQTGNDRAQLARDNTSQQLAALSTDALTSVSSDPYNTDLRALAAWQAAPTPDARGALLSAGATSFEGLLPNSGTDPAAALAATNDGRFVAAGDDDCIGVNRPVCGTLRIWDTATRRELVDQTYSGSVTSLAFTPDGNTLVVGAIVPQFQAQVWNMRTLRPTATLGVAGSLAMAVSPDGRTVVVGRPDGVTVWQVATRTAIATLPTGGAFPRSLAFSPDGRLLAAGVNDDTVHVWNTATLGQVAVLTGHTDAVRAVAFSPDGHTLASASQDSTVRLWRTDGFVSTAVLRPLAGGLDIFGTVAFSPDSSAVFAGGTNSQIITWETATGTLLSAMPYDGGNLVAAIVAVPGMTLSAYGNGDVLVQGTAIGVPYSTQPVYGGALDYRHGVAATSDQAGNINLWNYRISRPITVLRAGAPVPGVAFAPDGASLAAAGSHQVTVWDVATGRPVHSLPLADPRSDGNDVQYSPDGRFLVAEAVGTSDPATALKVTRSVDVWDTRTWRLVLVIPSSGVPSFAVAPTGAEIAVTSGSDIQLWDPATRRRTATWSTGKDVADQLVFVPGGHLLLTGNHDGTVSEWDTVTHAKLRGFLGAASPVHAMTVSPDGNLVAVSGQDPVINIYSIASHDPVATLRGHRQRVNTLVFNQDSTNLLSTSDDGVAAWWNLVPSRAVSALCLAVRGPRLATSWRQFADLNIDIGSPPC